MIVGDNAFVVDPHGFSIRTRVQIRKDWERAGRKGTTLGPSVIVNGQSWTPVLWEDGQGEDGFEFQKTISLGKP